MLFSVYVQQRDYSSRAARFAETLEMHMIRYLPLVIGTVFSFITTGDSWLQDDIIHYLRLVINGHLGHICDWCNEVTIATFVH